MEPNYSYLNGTSAVILVFLKEDERATVRTSILIIVSSSCTRAVHLLPRHFGHFSYTSSSCCAGCLVGPMLKSSLPTRTIVFLRFPLKSKQGYCQQVEVFPPPARYKRYRVLIGGPLARLKLQYSAVDVEVPYDSGPATHRSPNAIQVDYCTTT